MTIPSERSYAVAEAHKFLRDLSIGVIKKIPKAVRERARRVLRHYPGDFHLNMAAELAPKIFGPIELDPSDEISAVIPTEETGASLYERIAKIRRDQDPTFDFLHATEEMAEVADELFKIHMFDNEERPSPILKLIVDVMKLKEDSDFIRDGKHDRFVPLLLHPHKAAKAREEIADAIVSLKSLHKGLGGTYRELISTSHRKVLKWETNQAARDAGEVVR